MPRIAVPLLLIGLTMSGAAHARRVDAPTHAIATVCGLEGWQYGLDSNAQDQVRVELSPTLSDAQVLCVYQTLSDYKVTLDRPAPVQVLTRTVAPPTTLP